MNLTEKVHEWVDVTDADVANAIFGDYGITPADENTRRRFAVAHRGRSQPDAARLRHPVPAHAGAAQRQALPRRLRRPAGQRTGYFAKPKLDGDPAVTSDARTTRQLDASTRSTSSGT